MSKQSCEQKRGFYFKQSVQRKVELRIRKFTVSSMGLLTVLRENADKQVIETGIAFHHVHLRL